VTSGKENLNPLYNALEALASAQQIVCVGLDDTKAIPAQIDAEIELSPLLATLAHPLALSPLLATLS